MIPVVTSTKTDKLVIDLAGVEAGAKIFVPCRDALVVSLAQTATEDQNRRAIACASTHIVEDFLLNIDISLLPVFAPEIRVIAMTHALSYFDSRYNS